jgi:hypothetical protein
MCYFIPQTYIGLCFIQTCVFNKPASCSALFMCPQIHNCHRYNYGHTLLSYLICTQCSTNPPLVCWKWSKFRLWSNFGHTLLSKCDQNHTNEHYKFSPALLRCFIQTCMFKKPASCLARFRCHQIHNYQKVLFGHTLLSYLTWTWCSTNPLLVCWKLVWL